MSLAVYGPSCLTVYICLFVVLSKCPPSVSVYLPVCLFFCVCLCLSSVLSKADHLSVFIFLSACVCLCLPSLLSNCSPFTLSCLFACLFLCSSPCVSSVSTRLSNCLPICLSHPFSRSICLLISPRPRLSISIHPSTCPYLYLSH